MISIMIQVSEAFAEMIFKHGFVHCDPHAANLLVRPLPSGKRSIFGKMFDFLLKLSFVVLLLGSCSCCEPWMM